MSQTDSLQEAPIELPHIIKLTFEFSRIGRRAPTESMANFIPELEAAYRRLGSGHQFTVTHAASSNATAQESAKASFFIATDHPDLASVTEAVRTEISPKLVAQETVDGERAATREDIARFRGLPFSGEN